MAINKIEMQDNNGNVLYPHTTGDLVNYDTAKTVNQKIDEAIANLTSLKAGLATAVNNKTGSSLTSDSTLADITSKINQIVTLSSGTTDANATAANILAGSTAYVKGNKVTGTMTNQGTKTSSLDCGTSYTIPAGYHNGSGQVTANSLASQTDATATAGQILSGYTAWINGSKITGSIASQGAQTITPSTTNKTIASGKYLSGVQTILGDANLVASNIISGKNIFGVAGTATVQSLGGWKYEDYYIAAGETLNVTLEKQPFFALYMDGNIDLNVQKNYENAAWWANSGKFFKRMGSGNFIDNNVLLDGNTLLFKVPSYSYAQSIRLFYN